MIGDVSGLMEQIHPFLNVEDDSFGKSGRRSASGSGEGYCPGKTISR
jgi:hypothetical protein